jgi:hypothetical protein
VRRKGDGSYHLVILDKLAISVVEIIPGDVVSALVDLEHRAVRLPLPSDPSPSPLRNHLVPRHQKRELDQQSTLSSRTSFSLLCPTDRWKREERLNKESALTVLSISQLSKSRHRNVPSPSSPFSLAFQAFRVARSSWRAAAASVSGVLPRVPLRAFLLCLSRSLRTLLRAGPEVRRIGDCRG